MKRSLILLSFCFFFVIQNCPAFTNPQSPADIYGDLFERVQLQKIFSDGKTFVDAIPKRNPEEIMADFSRQNPNTAEALRNFVAANFDIPNTNSPVPKLNTSFPPLREHINQLWSQLQRPALKEIPGSSSISLPETFIVPGGRFREVYYWDTYFTMLGLVADDRNDVVDSMLANFESLITRYGHIPNGTRTYYLSRSQPPFFALMVGLSKTNNKMLQRKYLTALKAEHDFWMKGKSCVTTIMSACDRVVKMDDGSLLNRYWDDRDTPRDESYAEDVATAKLTNRPEQETYRHLRAAAESGWDFSSRWLANPNQIQTIHTTDIVPVDLNSLLWAQEKEISRLCKMQKDKNCAHDFNDQALKRAKAIHKYLWIAKEKRFADFDFTNKESTNTLSAATLYPLFVKLATADQAEAIARTTKTFLLAEGGLRTTQLATGQQWDKPNGWAPLQWIAVQGLENYGKHELAKNIAARWLRTVNQTYRETGKLLEKYDVEERRPGGGGEYPLQDGFGWTNGVTRALIKKYPELDPDIKMESDKKNRKF